MITGIDISHWDNGINLSKIDVDFVICKATQGTDFTDNTYTRNMESALSLNLLVGAYHFADGGNAKEEARYFYAAFKPYLGCAIPVLDYEISLENDCDWCEQFISEFYRLSAVYPMLYISASLCSLFNDSWIPDYCPLWVAGYPKPYTDWIYTDCPYNVHAWGKPDIWQFTSSLEIPGYYGQLDGNIAYMSSEGFRALYGLGDIMLTNEDVEKIANAVWHKVIANSRGNKTAENLLSWSESYSHDMQPWVAEILKRIKIIQEEVTKSDNR